MAAPYHGWYLHSTVATALSDELHRMGFGDGPGANHEPTAEMVRAARRLQTSGARVVGMVPATTRVAVMPLAIRLALACNYLGVARVVVVDANTRLPALRSSGASQPRPELTSEEVSPGVVVNYLAGPPLPGLDLSLTSRVLERERARDALVLVDLTGFGELGEHLRAMEMTDGVLLVAVAGQTKLRALEASASWITPDKNLGVFLIG